MKAKIIAWAVFGLAVASLPAAMALNAPKARAAGIMPYAPHVAVSASPAPSVAPEASRPPTSVSNHRQARKTQPARKRVCRRIALTPVRPAFTTKDAKGPSSGSVEYCDWL